MCNGTLRYKKNNYHEMPKTPRRHSLRGCLGIIEFNQMFAINYIGGIFLFATPYE